MNMNKPNTEQVKAAINWQIYFSETMILPEDHPDFQAWLTEHPLHAIAWQQINHLHEKWRDMPLESIVEPTQTVSALQHKNDLLETTKKYLFVKSNKPYNILTALLIASLTVGYLYNDRATGLVAEYHSDKGEIKAVTLADGSRIVLNSQSTVQVNYTDNERLIVLKQGEVIAEVAPNANKAFIIETEQMKARALGTVYSVKRLDQHTSVATVVESKVQVCANILTPNTSCTTLVNNQTAAVNHKALQPTTSIDAAAKTAWQTKMVVANNMPLSELLALLKVNHKGWIRYDEQKLANHYVSGVYSLDNPTQTLEAVQKLTPIKFKTLTGYVIFVY